MFASSARRCSTRRATSTAFSPAFLVTCSVTAGNACPTSAGAVGAAGLARGVPRVARRRRRAVDDARDVAEVDRLAVVDRDDEVADVLRRLEEAAGVDADRRVAAHEVAGGQRDVGALQHPAHGGDVEAVRAEPRRVEPHLDHAAGSADGRDLAGAGHALQLRLDGVRDALEVERAARRVLRVQRQRDDRHVVDALGLDQRLADAEFRRQPVAVRQDRVVQPDDGVVARHADLVLDRDQRLARVSTPTTRARGPGSATAPARRESRPAARRRRPTRRGTAPARWPSSRRSAAPPRAA